MIPKRICTNCRKSLPLTVEFFPTVATKNKGFYGFQFRCYKCRITVSRDSGSRLYQRHKTRIKRQTKEWAEKNPEKVIAHKIAQRAIKNGELTRGKCENCDNTKTVAHHEDYSKPLEVIWLCGSHHRKLHNQRNIIKLARESK